MRNQPPQGAVACSTIDNEQPTKLEIGSYGARFTRGDDSMISRGVRKFESFNGHSLSSDVSVSNSERKISLVLATGNCL